jgi:hypothetical protein
MRAFFKHKFGAGKPSGVTASPLPVATERDAPLTTRKRPAPPRLYTVELEHQGLVLFVTGIADNELQAGQIIGRKWPEWKIVAVREES